MTVQKQEEAALNYRFSLDAVQALKARVLLYMRDWQGAYDAATSLLPKYALLDFKTLSTDTSGKGNRYEASLPWKQGSPEAILAWERPFSGGGSDYINACHLSDRVLALINKKTQETGATGKTNISSQNLHYNYITTRGSDYIAARVSSDRSSLRIAEMYLIAATAGSNLTGDQANAKG